MNFVGVIKKNEPQKVKKKNQGFLEIPLRAAVNFLLLFILQS